MENPTENDPNITLNDDPVVPENINNNKTANTSNSSVKASEKYFSDLTYTELIITIIVSWILIALWQRVVDNFTYGYLGLNQNSVFHSAIVALVVTIIFFAYIFLFHTVNFFLADRFSLPTD